MNYSIYKNIISFLLLSIISLIFQSDAFAVNPEKTYKAKPDKYNISYKELKITTSDKYVINIWDYGEKDNSLPIIIIAGGDAGNMGYNISYAFHLQKAGFHVISFDYRGFGESQEFKSERGMLYYSEFSNDLSAVIKYAKKNFQDQKIAVLGLSMGSIISFLAYKKNKYDYFIGDGVVHSPQVLADRWKSKGKIIKVPFLNESLSKVIEDIKIPFLIFSGKKDTVTIPEDSKQLAVKSANRKIFEHEGGHLQGIAVLKDLYAEEIKKFIKQF